MITMLLSALASQAAGVQPAAQSIYEDSSSGITINYLPGKESELAEFTSTVPPGWGFLIRVDGDQDGAWGIGTGLTSARTSSDKQFAQTQFGIFGPQHILTAAADNPARTQSATPCGELVTSGHVELSAPTPSGWVEIKYKIPPKEIFGDRVVAHVQACLWDTMRWSCQHSPKDPAKIRR